jgi:hypothetical protein
MATVYEAFDQSTRRALALKRMHPTLDAHRQQRLLDLFEREFYTLSQISHPCIVEAYDYGVDAQGPYYTMELLQGGELQTLAPLPYKRACEIGRDLCSALSLLHSRRLVYRDLNPRNVHCALGGASKLIDFGAIASMGPCLQVVGTPAYCAPEALDLQPLDARTDLYSLGATLYFMLTGQHAYPAKTFAQLRQCWDARPARPSLLVRDVPAALDSIVMELMNLDPAQRPANAGELMEQLCALAGQTVDERQQVMQAYLSTPNLVGRATQLTFVRSKLRRAVGGHGSALLLTSGSGMGRSRLLAACLLEAKMSGALTLHAAPSELDADYATIRALSTALFETAAGLATRAAQDQLETLAQFVPELAPAEHPSLDPSATPPALQRSKVLAAISDWFSAVARERPLMIGVDDFQRIDEPSAACLARIAHDTDKSPLLIVVTRETETSAIAPSALKLFESTAAHVPIVNLTAAQSEELLRSVFGNVPHVQMVARELHQIAAGNPRDTLRLAQNLLDRGVARYRSGAWSLPSNFDHGQLPLSMAEAIASEFGALASPIRLLARVLSLASDRALSFDECVRVFPDQPAKSIHESLQELVRAQFAKLDAELFTIAHSGLHATLRTGIDADELATAHRKLAEVFSRRDNEQFRQAKHRLLAGDAERGIDELVAFSTSSQQLTDNDPDEYVKLVRSMPGDWLEVFSSALSSCERLQRPRTDTFRLRNRLGSFLNVLGAPLATSRVHLIALIRQLSEDSGLDDHARLDTNIEPGPRLSQALAAAKHRYDASPEATRGLEPGFAIRCLVRAQILAAGMVAIGLDHPLAAALPSIAAFSPLSPSIGVIEKLVRAVAARVSGRHDYTRQAYQQILERTAQPDLAGLDPSNHRFLRFGVMYGLAVLEAGMGLASCRPLAETLAGEPLHEVNALQVDMLYEFWLGRIREADHARERVELRRIESSSRQMADGTHLVWQAVAHACSDDLTHIKQVVEELRPFAQRHDGWTRVVDYATGEYHRIRGDLVSAAERLRAALHDAEAGTHQIWPHAAGSYVGVLCSLGRTEEAVNVGTQYLRSAERAELGYVSNYIRMPLAVALAASGAGERASLLADSVIDSFNGLGSAGLNLVLAYEARCRVAIHALNTADYERFAHECAEHCRSAGSRALRTKYDRLEWAARSNSLAAPSPEAASLGTSMLETGLKSAFRDCEQPGARAQRSLQLLLSGSGASEGALYLIGPHGAVLAAQVGATAFELSSAISDFVDLQLEDQSTATLDLDTDSESSVLTTQIGRYAFVLLSHQVPAGLGVTGVAALAPKPGTQFVHPGRLATRLSRMLADLGDAVPLTAE